MCAYQLDSIKWTSNKYQQHQSIWYNWSSKYAHMKWIHSSVLCYTTCGFIRKYIHVHAQYISKYSVYRLLLTIQQCMCVCVCFTSTYYVCAPYSSQVNLQRFHIRSSDCYLFDAFCFVFLPPRLHILYIYYHSMRNSSFCTHFRLTMPLFVVKSTSGNKCSCRRSAS